MQRPLLLIVDGESLRVPGLEKAMEKEGWDLAWTTSQQALNVGLMGQEPALVLVDLARSGAAGARSAMGLRQMNPRLPVVVIKGADEAPVAFPATAYLDRALAPEQWPTFFKGYLPVPEADRKFTSEDLFGDILADMGGSVSGKEPEPPKPHPVEPMPVPVKAPIAQTPAPTVQKPVAAPVVEPVVPAEPRPEPKVDPRPLVEPIAPAPVAPASSVLPDLFGELLGPAPEVAPPVASSKPKQDFTLSGISGIHDPFDVRDKVEVALPESRPELPSASPESDIGSLGKDVLELEFIGSNDSTPITRPKDREAGSLVHQPPQKVPAPPEVELLKEPLDTASLEEFGNYYLLEKIAVGGMAELFKARQRGVHNFEKIVAIKRILPHLSDNDEFVRMFIDEAKLAAQLTHPNIVQIFDLGKAGGFYYIAMEYVDGKDLRSLLRKVREYRTPFPEAVAACVTMKVAMALDYAHRKRGINDKELKLVHRDVSPQNVLISGDGAVKLVDFGIAKAATKSTQTMAGALKGKLLYMSPEQALGQSLDNRSDIYSLGLVLFELLTGERCFQADSELGVLEKVRLGKVQDIQTVNPVVSKDMAQILTKALQKNVDQRYASARLMERDLKTLLVKQGNEPTDHEIAEYVNILLKGTKEQLDALLANHFLPKVAKGEPVPAAPVMQKSRMEDPPTTVEMRRTITRTEPTPLPPSPRPPARELPRWLLPVLLTVALVLLLVFWYTARGANG